MAYHHDMKAALIKWFGKDKVHFIDGWDRKHRGIGWQGKYSKPVALLVHHTAGAATSSTDPKHAGNQHGANDGQWQFVQSHYEVPAANFTLDRDGCLYVHSVYPVWHAGKGSFKGVSPYDTLGVRDDMGNDYMLGVEVVSKGMKKDFTAAQKWGIGYLAQASKEACGWKGVWKRLPNHKTWAPTRKVDTRYTLTALRSWAAAAAARRVVS